MRPFCPKFANTYVKKSPPKKKKNISINVLLAQPMHNIDMMQSHPFLIYLVGYQLHLDLNY